LSEAIAYLDDKETGWVMDPRDGLATTTKFLPTVADLHEFLRKRREREEQFVPKHSHLPRFTPQVDRVPEPKVYGAVDPYPALTAEFGYIMVKHRLFETLHEASRALATQGREAAAAILERSSP